MLATPDSIETLARQPLIRRILDQIPASTDSLLERITAVQQIPAPTFAEADRATHAASIMRAIGLDSVTLDEHNNVFGRLPGASSDAPVIVSAHSDTVFPAGTDLTLRHDGDRVYGPGIADNSAGVGGILTLASWLIEAGLAPARDIWFVVNVAEEGLGDLRGMRHVVTRFGGNVTGYIVVEGGMYGYLLHEAIGVRRFRVEAEADGGHSWSDFGRTNAIHVIGRLIAAIDNITVPTDPKTSYNIGVVKGGTSVNTIAARAAFQLDLRSESQTALTSLVDRVQAEVTHFATQYSNHCRLSLNPIGNRPAGEIPRDHWLVRSAEAALAYSGCQKIQYLRGSTDANIPLSRGYPAVVVGLAQCGNAHRLDEYLDTSLLAQGMEQLLLLTVAAAGHTG